MEHPTAAAELVGIDDPEVDITRIQGEVVARAEAMRGAPLRAEQPSPLAVAGPRRLPALDGTDIRPYADLTGGRLTTGLKRAVRRGLRWFLWPVAGAMSVQDRAQAAVLAEHRRQLARLDMEVERLSHEIDLSRRVGRP